MKADIVVLPIMFVLSWVFWGFIWHAAPVPSDAFPSAQINWELRAKNDALLYSSTFVADKTQASGLRQSQFMEAVHPKVIAAGAGITVGLFGLLSSLGLPVMFVYGIIRGLGQLPHYMVLEIAGALLGRFYFRKKYGEQRFLRNAPTVLAGYFTGVGLISMATIALRLVQSAVSSSPF
jgi:hypothetical protein